MDFASAYASYADALVLALLTNIFEGVPMLRPGDRVAGRLNERVFTLRQPLVDGERGAQDRPRQRDHDPPASLPEGRHRARLGGFISGAVC